LYDVDTPIQEMGALQEARWLHGLTQPGSLSDMGRYFTLFRKHRPGEGPLMPRKEGFEHALVSSKSYRMDMLGSVVNVVGSSQDVYLSQSSFVRASRKKINFKQVRSAWVDLDLYNLGLEPNVATVNQLLTHGRALGIPAPSLIIHSGRGCYLKWVFDQAITNLRVWESLQAVLTALYRSFAADLQARDACRVFRLIGTVNSRSGAPVHVIDGSGLEYSFNVFVATVEALRVDELLPAVQRSRSTGLKTFASTIADGALRGNVEELELFGRMREPLMLGNKLTAESLNWSRFCDLRDIMIARGGIPEGQRDFTMFWMCNFLAHARVITSRNWEREVRDLLRAFPSKEFDPVAERSLSTLVKRIEVFEEGKRVRVGAREIHPLYTPGNEYLIETFAIQPDEMPNLKTIVSEQEKRRRADLKNPGRSQRRETRRAWRDEIKAAFDKQAEPPNFTALAKEFGLSRTTVSRYWNGLRTAGAAQTPTIAAAQKQTDSVIAAWRDQEEARLALARSRAKKRMDEAVIKLRELGQLVRQERWAQGKVATLLGGPAATERKDSTMSAELERKRRLLMRATHGGIDTPPQAADHRRPSGQEEDLDGPWIEDSAGHEELPTPGSEAWDRLSTTRAPTAHGGGAAKGLKPSPCPERSVESPVGGGLSPAQRLRQSIQARTEASTRPVAAAPRAHLSPDGPQTPEPSPASTPVARPQMTARERIAAVARRAEALPPQVKESRGNQELCELAAGCGLAPSTFPTHEQWPSDEIPPGSKYSAEQWLLATDNGRNHVIEMQDRNESCLLAFPAGRVVTRPLANGVITTSVEYDGERPTDTGVMLCMAFSGCTLVAEGAFPQFPGAMGPRAHVVNGRVFRAIRPRKEYLDPDLAWRCNATFSGTWAADPPHDQDDIPQGETP